MSVNIRVIVIVVFLLLARLLPACSLKSYDYCKIAMGRQFELSTAYSLSEENQNEIPVFRKKYRTKATQVFLPIITGSHFRSPYDPRDFVVSGHHVDLKVSSALLPGKRGPPSC